MQNPTNPSVYACGDVSAHSLPLTPLSGIEAKIVAENIINKTEKKIDVPLVPSVVFTLPNLASIGYQEAEAKKRYANVIVNYASGADWYNAKRINAETYVYKILINKRTNETVCCLLISQASKCIIFVNISSETNEWLTKPQVMAKQIYEDKGFMSMPNHDFPCWCDACKSWNEFFNRRCREYAFNIEKNKKDRLLNNCLLDARKKRKPDDCEIVSKVNCNV